MTMEEVDRIEGWNGRNNYLITCNEAGCKSSLDAKERLFGQAVVYLKAKGWRIYKSHGSWMHTCPECQRKNEPSIPDTTTDRL